MNWLLAIAALIVVGLSLAFFMRRNTPSGVPAKGHREQETEQSDHSESSGALKNRSLRTDNLSKEVELAWEAAETIEFQPGAYAWPRDFIDEKRPATYEDRVEHPVDPKAFRDEQYFLPERYGKDRLVLMARDPQWVYAYWEITHEKYRRAMEKHVEEWGLSRPALRLYDITPGSHPRTHLDVLVAEQAGDWYVHVDKPRHTLIAEFGRLYPGGFIPLLRSNPVTLPPRSFDMEIALEWSESDWMRLYGRMMPGYYASSPMVWRQ
ncbi:MAG TPA: DUF4912 domain-containing protein [Firmicutes bacterium]|nr:DUF4912 domain-containing protein [Candidatus Fermentithermobacillaceae bacterium]